MPLTKYGVLKGHIVGRRMERNGPTPHFHVHVDDGRNQHRLSIDVKSKKSPSELFYLIIEDFDHPILADLPALSRGFTELSNADGDPALDYIRGNLFDPERMLTLPYNVPGPDNDLNEKIDSIMKLAKSDQKSVVYAFGEPWGPDPGNEKIFGFSPKRGIHDIHMNQGNGANFNNTDGIWQDGALFIWLPSRDQWVAIFLAFQSQSWHTDNDGHRLTTMVPNAEGSTMPLDGKTPSAVKSSPEHEGMVRIVAAMVNPFGGEPEDETVTLINLGPNRVDMSGWKIVDLRGHRCSLNGSIKAGATKLVHLPNDVRLGNQGGTIMLLDRNNLKVHGVSYTKKQGVREGWTVLF
jgi:uncharacterized protein YukJ